MLIHRAVVTSTATPTTSLSALSAAFAGDRLNAAQADLPGNRQPNISRTTISPATIFPTRGTDTVHFSKTTDPQIRQVFLLPRDAVVVLSHGLLDSTQMLTSLGNFLRETGHEVHVPKSLGVQTGRKLGDCARYLADRVDNIRIDLAKRNLARLENKLERKGADRQQVIADFFGIAGLSADRQKALAGLIDNWLFQSEFNNARQDTLATQIKHLPSNPRISFGRPKQGYQQLSQLLKPAHRTLPAALLASGLLPTKDLELNQQLLLAEKVSNRILDTLAPRVVLIGHSMGGEISHKNLIDPDMSQGVGMSVAMGSPLAGTEALPKSIGAPIDAMEGLVFPPVLRPLARNLMTLGVKTAIDATFPAAPQMRQGSRSIENIQHTPLPPHTNAVAIGNEEDGLVSGRASQLNSELDRCLNLQIKPKSTLLANLLKPDLDGLFGLAPGINVFVRLMDRSAMTEGLRQHCSFVDHHAEHWGMAGEIKAQIFDGPNSVENLRPLLDIQSYEPLQRQMLTLMRDMLTDPEDPKDAAIKKARWQALRPDLERIASLRLPFTDSADQVAREVLDALDTSN